MAVGVGRGTRLATVIFCLLSFAVGAVLLAEQWMLERSIDAGEMSVPATPAESAVVASGWNGWSNGSDLKATHRLVPGLSGVAQEISPERGNSNASTIWAVPTALRLRTVAGYVFSFWYRRAGSNQDESAAYAGYGDAKSTIEKHPLPVTADWTYVELLIPQHVDPTHRLSFWALTGTTLQVDEVGLRPASPSDQLSARMPKIMATTQQSEIQYEPVSTGLFTWQRPGVDIGTMEVTPDRPGIAGGIGAWARNTAPDEQTHRLVPGRTGGLAQELSTAVNPAVAIIVPAQHLENQDVPADYTLGLWYRFLSTDRKNSARIAIRNKETRIQEVIATLPVTEEWSNFTTTVAQPDGPGEIIISIQGQNGSLVVDDISLVDSNGIAGYVPVVRTREVVTPTPEEANPAPTPPRERPPFMVELPSNRLAFVYSYGGIGAVLREAPLAIGLMVGSLLGLSLLSFSLSTFLLGLLQGIVLFEPAPVDLHWVFWLAGGLVAGQIVWRRAWQNPPLLGALGLLAAGNLVSWLSAGSGGLSYMAVTFYLVAMAASLIMLLKKEENLVWLVRGLIGAALLASFSGIAVALNWEPALTIFGDGYRFQGLFKDPNVLGPYLVGAILLLLDQALSQRRRSAKSLSVVLTLPLLLSLLLTQGRAALGAMVLSLLVYGFLHLRSSSKAGRRAMVFVVASLLVTGAALFILLETDLITDRLLTTFESYDTGQRFPVQVAGIRLGLSTPLGIGPGAFEKTFNFAAHSLYVRTFTENGWLGLIGLSLLIGYTLYSAWKRLRTPAPRIGGPSLAVLLAWFVGVLANSIVIDTVHWRHFWLFLGLLWLQIIRHDEAMADQNPAKQSEQELSA